MDLNTIESVAAPRALSELPGWRPGDAWLAGGTWLFSEPQPELRRLVDLSGLGWAPHAVDAGGLWLAATRTIARLARLELPPAWAAAPLAGLCCRALLGSFKIWNAATVGGNLCAALPAGPIAALATALDGTCTVWTPDGGGREVAAKDFVLGPRRTALRAGEVLRGLHMPAAALRRRAAFRRVGLSPDGRSSALLIGTLGADGRFALTVTASTRRPVRLDSPRFPDARGLRDAMTAGIGDALRARPHLPGRVDRGRAAGRERRRGGRRGERRRGARRGGGMDLRREDVSPAGEAGGPLERLFELREEAIPACVAAPPVPFTCSIANGAALGFIAWAALKPAAERGRDTKPVARTIAAVFLCRSIETNAGRRWAARSTPCAGEPSVSAATRSWDRRATASSTTRTRSSWSRTGASRRSVLGTRSARGCRRAWSRCATRTP